jgi:hypothetical protein
MKLTKHILPNDISVSFVCLSVEEEYAMSKWYMEVLCLPWLDTKPEFQKFIEQTFWRKCHGKDFTKEQAEQLCDYNERYSEILPAFPKLRNNNKCITPHKYHTNCVELNRTERKEYIVWVIKNAWKETWDGHADIKTKTKFNVFPGEEPNEEFIAKQKQLEVDFWQEVSIKQDEYECERPEAVLAVSDYMARAEPEHRLTDPLGSS